MHTVRELIPGDAGAFREVRLEALRLHPQAFGSAYTVEAREAVDDFAARIARGGLFGGFIDGQLQGIAGFSVRTEARLIHKGYLGGMYVREPFRGTGLADAIVEAVLAHARTRVEHILLSVASPNLSAVRFYRRMGFEPYATEPRAMKVDGIHIDEILMIRRLGE